MSEAQTYDPYQPRSPVPPEAVKAAAKKIGQAVKKGPAPEPEKDSEQVEAFTTKETGASDAHGIARDQLRSFVERIERLEEERATIGDDIKDVYGEAKSMGFVLRKVVSIRNQDHDARMEQEAVLDTYLAALGMLPAGEDA